jgi:hypothetical protein
MGNKFATTEVGVPQFKYAVSPFTAERLLDFFCNRIAFRAGVFECGPHCNHAVIVQCYHFQEVTATQL